MSQQKLVDQLRCSAILRQPNATDKDWFDSASRPSVSVPPASTSTPAGAPGRPRCASLSLLLREVGSTTEMLVIKRAINPRRDVIVSFPADVPSDKWSGHIALPGGGQEQGESELQAAVRECEEEIGVSLIPSRFELLGRLKDTRTSSIKHKGYTVSTFVFVLTDSLELPLKIQPSEVASAWWVDTALFFPNAALAEIGFPVTSLVKATNALHWKVMMRLFNAEIAYFPCFFLPPPPLREGEIALRDTSTATVPSKEVRDTNAFVMWGLTFGVVSNLVVAAGGCAFAYPAPPHFRFRGFVGNMFAYSFYTLQAWASTLCETSYACLTASRVLKQK